MRREEALSLRMNGLRGLLHKLVMAGAEKYLKGVLERSSVFPLAIYSNSKLLYIARSHVEVKLLSELLHRHKSYRTVLYGLPNYIPSLMN